MAGKLYAQSTGAGRLLVLSKTDHTLAIVDPVSFQVLAKVPVGPDPHEVIAATDGKTAYVSIYGFGVFNTLDVIDLVNAKALPSIDLGPLRGPHGLTFVGGKTWFTAEGAKSIGRYDPATQTVDWVMGTGQNRTHMIYVSPDMQHIITTNVSSDTVSLIDYGPVRLSGIPGPPTGMRPPGQNASGQNQMPPRPPQGPRPLGCCAPMVDWNETVIAVGRGSEGFDLSPDGKEIWVANALDGTISVIDYAAKKVVDTLAANVRNANRLKFTLDGKLVLVGAGAELVVVDAVTRQVVKRIQVGNQGHGAGGILMQPDGARAFVSLGPDNFVAVVDLKTLEVVGHINAGGGPDGLAWAEVPTSR
jgi:YVTN family beta-propeller protein